MPDGDYHRIHWHALPAVLEPKGVAQRLEEARKTLGWSGREVSRRAGLKNETFYTSAITNLQSGGSVSTETLRQILQAFVAEGFRPVWILAGTGTPRGEEDPREAAIQALVLLGNPEAQVRAAAELVKDAPVGLGAEWWANRIRSEMDLMPLMPRRAKVLDLEGEVVATDDDSPDEVEAGSSVFPTHSQHRSQGDSSTSESPGPDSKPHAPKRA
jgi:transcriptional regulator with XRE-family HTH domain